MATLNLPNVIENETQADAVELEQNNTVLEAFVNTQLIHRDGAVAMTGQLHLVGDPVSEDDAARKAYVDAILPVGVILPYGGLVAPAGRWALANGALLNTAEFPELFAVYQYRYGGAGAQFALPNIQGRSIFGYNAADTDFNTVGKTGGTKSVPLLQHSHTIDHDHGAVNTGTESAFHSHGGVDHLHGFSGSTGGRDTAHTHTTTVGVFYHDPFAPGFTIRVNDGSSLPANYGQVGTGTESADHAHGFSGVTGAADRSLTTGTQSAFHTHTLDMPNFAGSSGNSGTAGATMVPPYIALPFIVRTD
jgi:microcystin-dependent protein